MIFHCKYTGRLLWMAAFLFAGCIQEPGVAFGPPEGWQAAPAAQEAGAVPRRWWQAGVDTSRAFRRLETLQEMGVDHRGLTYAAGVSVAAQGDVARPHFIEAVKRSLIRLYRNEPEVVDSLFERFVTPKIEAADLAGNTSEEVERFKREGYRLIGNNFQEPRTALRIGTDVPIAYPDSLREREVGGSVRTQVYLDAEGHPQAIELLEGVHPVLDQIAMEATARMRWRPAYLMRNGNWRPVPSWVRFNITFGVPPAEAEG